MPLSNWTIHKSGTDIEVGITTLTPIEGTGNLRIRDNGNHSFNAFNTTYTNGKTRGKIRGLIRLMTVTGSGTYRVGAYFLTSSANINSTGDFYGFHVTTTTTSRTYQFSHHTGGIGGTKTDLYTTAPITTVTLGTTILPFEIEWHVESELDGVHLIMRGDPSGGDTLTNFSNLATIGTVIVTNPTYKLTTTVGEGIYASGLGGTASGLSAHVDLVTIYSQTLI
jgi:hypothetical protein